MEDQNHKTCPYCGETILASAKKCRYCQSWLDGRDEPSGIVSLSSKQPVAELVQAETVVPQVQNVPPQVIIVKQGEEGMSKEEASKFYEKKKEQDESMEWLYTESLIISALFVACTSYPWWFGLIIFIIMCALCSLRFLRILFCIFAILIWTGIGAGIGALWNSEVLGGCLAGIAGLCAHWGAIRKQV